MSGPYRLRATLAEHAAQVQDTGLGERAGAVRRRVAAARRRRRALAAGGVVAASGAVAAVLVGATLLPLAPPEASEARLLAGTEAPATITSLGSTYAFADGVEGAEEVRVPLAGYDEPVLVSWATAGDDDTVELAPGSRDALVERTRDFDGFRLVPDPADAPPLVVRGEGEVAAAVYTLTDRPPAGVTAGGSTWRDQVAGSQLVAGEVGTAGQTDVRVDLTPAATAASSRARLRWYSACTGVPAGYQVVAEATQGGKGLSAPLFTCQGGSLPDDLATSAADVRAVPAELAPSDPAALRLTVERVDGRVVAGDDDPELAGVTLATAVYESAAPAARLAGHPVPAVVEQDGHRWGYVAGRAGRADRVSAPAPAQDGPVLVTAYHGATGGPVRLLRDGEPVATGSGVGGGGSFGGLVESAPGRTWSLVAPGAGGRGAGLALAFYERLD